jgi:hypothetical protein
MSSALARILAAGMVIGDGPEKVSREVERGLDLRGEWEGMGVNGWEEATVRLKGDVLTLGIGGQKGTYHIQFADDGHGKFRMSMTDMPPQIQGRYEMGEGSVVLTFWVGLKRDKEVVITLERINPRK